MVEPVTFGRRGAPSAAPSPARELVRPEPSSPQVEALAASMRDASTSDVAAFARWRKERAPRRLVVIGVGLALMAPGLLCLLLQAPDWISFSLEGAGFFANGWLRRERRRQAAAITAWMPDG